MATQPTLRRDFWVSGTDAMGYRTAANIKAASAMLARIEASRLGWTKIIVRGERPS